MRASCEPHRAPSCELALRAVGLAGGHPGGGGTWCLREGHLGVGAHPPSRCLAAGRRCQRAVGAGVQACRPGTGSSAYMPRCVLRAAGLVRGRPEFGSSRRGERSLGLGGSPSPRLPVPGANSRGPLPVSLWRGQRGYEGLAPTPQLTVLQDRVGRCGAGRRASPGGGHLVHSCGPSRVRCSHSPGCPSLGQAVRACCPHAVGAVCRPGAPALALWLACLAGRCVPRGFRAVHGGLLPPLSGACGVRRSPSPGCRSLGQADGCWFRV